MGGVFLFRPWGGGEGGSVPCFVASAMGKVGGGALSNVPAHVPFVLTCVRS